MYSLRTSHNKSLISKTSDLNDRDFKVRSLYINIVIRLLFLFTDIIFL